MALHNTHSMSAEIIKYNQQCETMWSHEDTGNLPCSRVSCPGQHSYMLCSLMVERMSNSATSTLWTKALPCSCMACCIGCLGCCPLLSCLCSPEDGKEVSQLVCDSKKRGKAHRTTSINPTWCSPCPRSHSVLISYQLGCHVIRSNVLLW